MLAEAVQHVQTACQSAISDMFKIFWDGQLASTCLLHDAHMTPLVFIVTEVCHTAHFWVSHGRCAGIPLRVC